VIAGGVGGAKFLRGLREVVRESKGDGADAEITTIVNIGDDAWMNGLRVTPDLDSIMYTLSGENDEERGWGRREESSRIAGELEAYGLGVPWFTLGDLDISTHIARSSLLRGGQPLSSATAHLCARWDLGVTLLPATDQEAETRVHTEDGQDLHFQEWWVRHRASLKAERFEFRGAAGAPAAPGVVEAITGADRVILAPSNPVVSVGAVLAIDEIRHAVEATPARVVGVSPIIEGRVVRGMADACLEAIGVETSARAVGLHYGSRAHAGVLDAWLVDTSDAGALPALRDAGIDAQAVPLWMSDLERSAELARQALTA